MKKFLFVVLFSFWPLLALAHSYVSGDIQIGHIWAPPTAVEAERGIVYVPFFNKGTTPDRLLKAETSIAVRAVLRTPDGQEAQSIELPASKGVALRPKGWSISLEGLKGGYVVGDKFTLRLTFAKAPPINVQVYVENHGQH